MSGDWILTERDVCDAWHVKWHRSRRVRKRRIRRAWRAWRVFSRLRGWHGHWMAQGRLRVMLGAGVRP